MKIIGTTQSGKTVFSHRTYNPYDDAHYANFTHDEIQEAIDFHEQEFLKLRDERRLHLRAKSETTLSPKDYKLKSNQLNRDLDEHYSSITGLSQRGNYNESQHTSKYPYLSYDYKEKELARKK